MKSTTGRRAVRQRILGAFLLLGAACCALAGAEASGPDAAPWLESSPARPASHPGEAIKHSRYIPGKDGTRLAIDYYLPRHLKPGERLPAILQQTRYFRSVVLKSQGMASCRSIPEDFGYFTARGYAVVVVDVRGTGASFGTRITELGEAEIADSAAVADWIVAQPWSSGSIGTTGISYVGALAELALLTKHPAFKAAVPLYPAHDSFADLYFPGGMKNHLHGESWGRVTAEMDKAGPGQLHQYPEVIGPCPVDGDEGGSLLAAARAQHQGNSNRAEELRGVQFRDEVRMPGRRWSGAYLLGAELDSVRVPMLVIAGWHDSAFGDGAINRFLSRDPSLQWLVLAPTSHGGDYFYAPGVETAMRSSFDVKAQMLRFFDAHLMPTAQPATPAPHLRWFASGANAWREADQWPQPAAERRFCLTRDSRLDESCAGPRGTLQISPADIRSAPGSRWHTSMGQPITYPDRAKRDAGLPRFQTTPLAGDLEIFGSPMLALKLRTTGDDADVVAYLEEVEPSGRALYVTEGLLRASHAKPGKLPYRTLGAQRTDLREDARPVRGRDLQLLIRLLPVAHRFKAGSALRLVIAGSDVAVFDTATRPGDRWEMSLDAGPEGSALTLPVAALPAETQPGAASASPLPEAMPRGPDAAPWHAASPARAPIHSGGALKRSTYLSAADGVRLAIDYYLPKEAAAGTELPTILQQTRYFRSSVLKGEEATSCKAVPADIEYFTSRGYAFAILDVRGTGASFGAHPSELSDAEIADTTAVADWIVAQPWSSGSIVTTGISYVGMLAELALLVKHPAIKGAAPLYPGYDLYSDLHFPGGMKGQAFIEAWGTVTAEMDKAGPGGIVHAPFLVGPCPVDGDDGTQLAAARAQHHTNRDLVKNMAAVEFRDDGRGLDDRWPSAYLRREQLDDSGVPTLFIAGWLDAAFGDGAINRFLTTRSRQQRLILGPHSHAGDYFYGPGTTTATLASFDQKAELLRFFDAVLSGKHSSLRADPALRWFVTGANEWRQAERWPRPASIVRWCIAAGGTLSADDCRKPAGTLQIAPADIGSSATGRWQTSMARPIVYPDRAEPDARLPRFQTPPLLASLEIFGSPVMRLALRTTGTDADVVVYLEEVDAAGHAWYVTEGLLRASHAKPGKLPYRSLGEQRTDLRKDRQTVQDREIELAVRLFPVSHRFSKGSALRLVIAGSDTAAFASATGSADRWTLRAGGKRGASLTLPVYSP